MHADGNIRRTIVQQEKRLIREEYEDGRAEGLFASR
jgi:hypothetical protein